VWCGCGSSVHTRALAAETGMGSYTPARPTRPDLSALWSKYGEERLGAQLDDGGPHGVDTAIRGPARRCAFLATRVGWPCGMACAPDRGGEGHEPC
jgi:hypothetical protein